jgi:D-glycero-alpha-D-manno-heptose-7-phosphate kinase
MQPRFVLTRAPLRVSFAGGGTDLPAFLMRHGHGRIISVTLDYWIYVAVKHRFEGDVRVSYSETEIVSHARDLRHDLIRSCLLDTGVRKGVELTTMADVPGKGTGLGSSGALCAATMLALRTWRDFGTSTQVLAVEAARIDREYGGGYQDAYAAAYGGLLDYTFTQAGAHVDVVTHPPPVAYDNLGEHLLLIQIGAGRRAGAVLATQQQAIATGALDDLLLAQRDEVDEMRDLLVDSAWQRVGALMMRQWERKRTLPGVTDAGIDAAITSGCAAGAYGAKLCGAGGAGFLLFVAPPDRHPAIRTAVAGRWLPGTITSRGAHVVTCL